tara:strand:+ start:186 stop:611 length:426 start_codon:yes stop_codon:yes gene_type:complete
MKSRSKPKNRLPLPSLKDLGSVRKIRRRVGGSDVIYDNRDMLAQELINLSTAKISDVMTWTSDGKTQVKSTEDIEPAVLAAIKKIRVIPSELGNTIEIEMIDKVRVLQTLAKASGLMEMEKNVDKPAVVEVQMVGPIENDT